MGEGTGVLVIGGGPAGLAVAIAARMKGLMLPSRTARSLR